MRHQPARQPSQRPRPEPVPDLDQPAISKPVKGLLTELSDLFDGPEAPGQSTRVTLRGTVLT